MNEDRDPDDRARSAERFRSAAPVTGDLLYGPIVGSLEWMRQALVPEHDDDRP